MMSGNNVCATRPDKLGDVCQGDSGGSLSFKRDDGRYEVVGIVSYGFGCGSEFEGSCSDVLYLILIHYFQVKLCLLCLAELVQLLPGSRSLQEMEYFALKALH